MEYIKMKRLEAIKKYFDEREEYRDCCFWLPPLSIEERRKEEKTRSWSYKDEQISLSVTVSVSRKRYRVTHKALIRGRPFYMDDWNWFLIKDIDI